MLLYEKITELQKIFTTYKQQLEALQQQLESAIDSKQQAQKQEILQALQEENAQAQTQAQEILTQRIQEKLQEFFSSNATQLTPTLAQSLDTQELRKELAKRIASTGAVGKALSQLDISSQAQAAKEQANQKLQDLQTQLNTILASAKQSSKDFEKHAKTAATEYIQANIQGIAKHINTQELQANIAQSIATNLDTQALAQEAAKKANQRIETITDESLKEQLKQSAKILATEMLASEELRHLRFLSGLRVLSVQTLSTQEIVADIAAVIAKARNTREILDQAKRDERRNILLAH